MTAGTNNIRRLYRSRTDKPVTGLSGGIADYLGVDPSLVRVGWVVATVLTFPMAPVAYLIGAMIVPKEPEMGFGDGPVAGDTLSI